MLHIAKLQLHKSLSINAVDDGVILKSDTNIFITNVAGTSKLTINMSKGVVYSTTPYIYVLPACYKDLTTRIDNISNDDKKSETSMILVTQLYIDEQIWKQQIRINSMVTLDDGICDSFYNVYKLIDKIVGNNINNANNTPTQKNKKYGNLCVSDSQIPISMSDIISLIETVVLIPFHASIWGNKCCPCPIPPTVSIGEDGWYFKRCGVGEIVEWVVDTPNIQAQVIRNVYMNMLFFGSAKCFSPKLCMYVKSSDTNNTQTVVEYEFPQINTTAHPNTESIYHCMYTDVVPGRALGKICVPSQTTITISFDRNKTKGKMTKEMGKNILPTDIITKFEICTAEEMTNIEFIVCSLNVVTTTGTAKFQFSNAGVAGHNSPKSKSTSTSKSK
jgi:hypothetical protein